MAFSSPDTSTSRIPAAPSAIGSEPFSTRVAFVVTTGGRVDTCPVVVGVGVVVVDGRTVEVEPSLSEEPQAASINAKATNKQDVRRSTHLQVLHQEVYAQASAGGQRQDRNRT